MRILFFLLLAPVALLGQTSDGAIEAIFISEDSESSVPDSLEFVGATFLIPDSARRGSREDMFFDSYRVRFSSSFQWSHRNSDKMDWSGTWARTRLTTYAGKRLSSDLLAVRRVADPRTIDELHLAVSGLHEPTNLSFALGTFQYDWGLGILSSSAFGAARSFSYFRSKSVAIGKGALARTTSREASWLRGAALTKEFQNLRIAAFGNFREWNANDQALPAMLSGVLNTSNPQTISRRDRVEEKSFGSSLQFQNNLIATGMLAQTSTFEPEIDQAGKLSSLSVFTSLNAQNVQASAEIARSGAETAWMAVLSRGTEFWHSAFYAMYAAPDYYAPRSQAAFSFGEPFRNSRTIGLRLGTTRGRHDFDLDLRSNRNPIDAKSGALLIHSDEFTAGWKCDAGNNAQIAARSSIANRNENDSERRSLSLRVEPTWSRVLVWSSRFEYRRHGLSDNSEPSQGHYLHVQALRSGGKLKPGVRVAAFEIDDLDSPLQVYEPTVAGAYPLEILSGNGMRVSGWLTLDLGRWDIRAKFAWLTRESAEDSSEFAMALMLRQ